MTTTDSCDLCGLTLPNPPITRDVDGENKQFCCEGCARVYEVAAENNMLSQVLPQLKISKPVFADLIKKPAESAFFTIDGMWCPGCSLAAERVLRSQPGIKAADVSFAAERGRIEFDPAILNPQNVIKQLKPLGYQVNFTSSKSGKQKERLQERISLQLIAAIAFGMQVMLLYFVQLYPLYARSQFDSMAVRRLQFLVWLLATPVLFFGGLSFLQGAWRALLARTATMDSLVSLGVLSAYGYSVYITITGAGETYFDSVVMITVFILFGRYLETVGGAQARKDIHMLLTLQPEIAWRRVAEDWEKVQSEDLTSGDRIRVRGGERIPADGSVIAGEGAIDEAMLTGESLPVQKSNGDRVFAGTLLDEGILELQVSAPVVDSRLAHISNLVTETLSEKPPIQRLVDSVSTYFAFGIVAISILTFAGWFWLDHSLEKAILAGVAVLVVACPCALGLATPLALSISLSKAARKGVLVRTPAAIETATKVTRMVFDKTGTLTRGELRVAMIVLAPQFKGDKKQLLQLAASVEQFSAHPLARAITQANNEPLLEGGEFLAIQGAGASARLMTADPQRVVVGSSGLVKIAPDFPLLDQAEARAARGETVVWVDVGGEIAGFLALQDEPDPTVKPVLEWLQNDHIQLAVLSGDSKVTTSFLAEGLGIKTFRGGRLPEQKAADIRTWQGMGEFVAMVGDGVNDAPALAQADLSITVSSGSDVAGATSDLVLVRSDLMLIPWFLQLSRHTRQVIRENLAWAFAYNLLAVPLAVFGVISPVIAAGAMAVSSLLVVFNSLRLRSKLNEQG